MVSESADFDSQVVSVVHETIMLHNSYLRLSRDARVELGVRCRGMADDIGAALRKHFRGAIDD